MSAQTFVLLTRGLVHPSLMARRRLRAVLSRRGTVHQVRPRVARGLLERLSVDAGRVLPVAYLHHPGQAPEISGALCDWVRRGGALLGVHSATASFKGDAAYRELLGASFAGHGPVGVHALVRERRAPVDLPQRIRLTDEAYRHEFAREVDVWYRWEDGEPAAWTAVYGEGRIACLAPGHRATVWDGHSRRVLLALVDWLMEAAR